MLIFFPVLILLFSFIKVFDIRAEDFIKSENIVFLIITFVCCVFSIVLISLTVLKSRNTDKKEEKEGVYSKEENINKNYYEALMSMGEAVIITDINERVVGMNKLAEDLTGWNFKEAEGCFIEEIYNILDKKSRKKCFNIIKEALELNSNVSHDNYIVLMSKKQNEYVISDNASPVVDNNGNVTGAVLVFNDITKEYLKQEELKYTRFHDNLTGLYNRFFITEEIKRLDVKRQLPISVITADVNGLKKINDLYGYSEGDRILVQIAGILKNKCRSEDIISRWGGDEFVLLLPQTTEENAYNIYRRINKALIDTNDIKINANISLGYATKTSNEQKIKHIIRKAEECMYRHKLIESKSMRNSIISSLGNGLYEKSYETRHHEERMSELCRKIGIEMKMKDSLLDEIILLAKLHDTGKIAIDKNILMKPGRLTPSEWEEIKKHPEIGYRIVKSIDELKHIAEGILAHHEHWNGNGYPNGLREDEIPISARIVSIIDAYDVMTHERPYRKAVSSNEAIEEIKRCSGTQFDPEIVEIFTNIISNFEK